MRALVGGVPAEPAQSRGDDGRTRSRRRPCHGASLGVEDARRCFAPASARLVLRGVAIELRQSKYLNNLIEQDHRSIKRIARPMLGFKDFGCARRLIAGIETMHMVKMGQLDCPKGPALSAADQFYPLAV